METADPSQLRNAAGAIRLAVSILRSGHAEWLAQLAAEDRGRIRAVLKALDAATAELVQHVGSNADAIAVETARALASRSANPPQPNAEAQDATAGPTVDAGPVSDLASALRRLEVITAVEPPPRPLLALDVTVHAQIPVAPDTLISALHSAAFGLVRSRPPRRQPWTVAVAAGRDEGPTGQPMVVIEMRCEVDDDSVARGAHGTDFAATLPPWLHECLRMTEACGGGLTRGRDGRHELVRVIVPGLADASDAATGPGLPGEAANDAPAAGPRRVA